MKKTLIIGWSMLAVLMIASIFYLIFIMHSFIAVTDDINHHPVVHSWEKAHSSKSEEVTE
ncbi:hypothetical protein ACFO4N_13045 [Camelliibacillus cellulosilyticus]|uniref:Tumor necrosis factor receptor superfamily member 19 n=1 Tax=Camelliibacillus cellulosilyticus TaxID=2174486 RepID=A0ABV9GNS5_9BACL